MFYIRTNLNEYTRDGEYINLTYVLKVLYIFATFNAY